MSEGVKLREAAVYSVWDSLRVRENWREVETPSTFVRGRVSIAMMGVEGPVMEEVTDVLEGLDE